jgi:hypothetical protein
LLVFFCKNQHAVTYAEESLHGFQRDRRKEAEVIIRHAEDEDVSSTGRIYCLRL